MEHGSESVNIGLSCMATHDYAHFWGSNPIKLRGAKQLHVHRIVLTISWFDGD